MSDKINYYKTIPQLLSDDPTRSVWSAIIEQNTYDKNLLSQFVQGDIDKKQFTLRRSERLRGQWQFGMDSYNIRDSRFLCKHACKYCYIGPMFARFGQKCQLIDMEDLMPMDMKKVNKKWKQVLNQNRKMYFFPSSSDIFAENAHEFSEVCKKIIDAGHEVFFTTKPSLKSISLIAEDMEKYKSKFIIFITISSIDNDILKMYEPNAPSYEERISVINFLIKRGFNVNVMIEPYLSDPIAIIENLPKVNGIIAIGAMNYSGHFKFSENIQENKEIHEYLNNLYKKENTMKLWNYVITQPNIFLKHHSINAILSYKNIH